MESNGSNIPDCEDHIFISYAHIDNTGIVEGHKGWVDAMHEYLAQRLSQVLGREPRIWRDPLLRGDEDFHTVLEQQLSKIEILVAVLSPRYIGSKECLKELSQFCSRAVAGGGIGIDTKARIFKVVKTPVDDCEHPKELQGLLGYRFYEMDQSGRPREFSHQFNFETHQKFLRRMDDLAWDMRVFIKSHQRHVSGSLSNPNPGTIYLAEVASDLEEKRDNIKREFLSHGYNVLPDKDLPRDMTRLEQAVRGDLGRSHLSLHLIGENYGFIPDKESVRSSVRLQYELAAAHRGVDSKFSQLIWMPRGLETLDERQNTFLEILRNAAATQPRTEVLLDKLEDLKKDVLDRLKASSAVPDTPRPEQVAGVNADGDPARIYLICSGQDYHSTEQLKDFLFDEGFEVIRSLQEGSTAERLEDNHQQLSLCDVAIIFHGQTSEMWLRQKLLDVSKSSGNDPSKKLLAKAVYLACPTTREKNAFRTLNATIVRDCGEFPLKDLIGFLDQVRGLRQCAGSNVRGGVG